MSKGKTKFLILATLVLAFSGLAQASSITVLDGYGTLDVTLLVGPGFVVGDFTGGTALMFNDPGPTSVLFLFDPGFGPGAFTGLVSINVFPGSGEGLDVLFDFGTVTGAPGGFDLVGVGVPDGSFPPITDPGLLGLLGPHQYRFGVTGSGVDDASGLPFFVGELTAIDTPEPGTLMLLGSGLVTGLLRLRRRTS